MAGKTAYVLDDCREFDRKQVDMLAAGVIPNINQTIDCKLIDMSEGGLRIELMDTDIPPNKIKLFVPETDCLMECEVVRRVGRELGLRIENKVTLWKYLIVHNWRYTLVIVQKLLEAGLLVCYSITGLQRLEL